MIELYWICFASFVMGMCIGVASRLWKEPAKRPPLPMGSLVRFRDQPRKGVFQVIGRCEREGAGSHAIFLQRVIGGEPTGVAGWHFEWELEPAAREALATQREAA